MISLIQYARIDPAPARTGEPPPAVAMVPAAAVLAIVLVTPFEVPVGALGSALTLTTVEVVSALAAAFACFAMVYAPQPLCWRTPVTPAILACLAIAFLAAILSSVDPGNALRFSARMAAAGVIFVLVLNAVTTAAIARLLVWTLLGVAVVVSVVAVLEVAQHPQVAAALSVFRPGFHVVGGQLRATSTLLYPTVTSMYLEVAFALGLWLLLDPVASTKRRDIVAAFVALATIGAGIIATFTRAGLIGMAAALALAGGLHYAKTRRLDRVHARLTALACVLVALVLVSRSPDVLLTRLSTEGSQDWYGARYSVPASLAFSTGAEYQVPVTLENTGRVVWDSTSPPIFAMSYHWLRADTDAVVEFDGWRTPFTTPVEPGGRVTMPVEVRAPGTPGRYVLVWDVVHEHRAWLSTEGVPPARSIVEVTGALVKTPTSSMRRLPAASIRADRFTLWRAAIAIAASNPLLGIGPDNFRKIYGRYIDQPASDTRVHANNMYLEALAGGGVVGFAVLLWLMVASAVALGRRWRLATVTAAPAIAAVGAAWLVIAAHGLVDSFLSFSATYVMFALAAGLAFSPGLDHADRV